MTYSALFRKVEAKPCRFKLKLLRIGHSVSPCIMAVFTAFHEEMHLYFTSK